MSGIKDSCYHLKDSINNGPIEAYREIQIIENSLEDTITLGFGIVYPGYVGKFQYLRLDEREDAVLDPETHEKHRPKTKLFCITLYKKRSVKGEIKIKYYY